MATSVTSHHIFGTKDVATPGTELQVDATSRAVTALMLIAHSDNVGRVFYGGSDVASTTQKGLEPGESVTISAGARGTSAGSFDISEIYIDAASGDDGVDFIAVRAL